MSRIQGEHCLKKRLKKTETGVSWNFCQHKCSFLRQTHPKKHFFLSLHVYMHIIIPIYILFSTYILSPTHNHSTQQKGKLGKENDRWMDVQKTGEQMSRQDKATHPASKNFRPDPRGCSPLRPTSANAGNTTMAEYWWAFVQMAGEPFPTLVIFTKKRKKRVVGKRGGTEICVYLKVPWPSFLGGHAGDEDTKTTRLI